MNPQLAWYVARAGGIVAWSLLTTAVVWGLLLKTRLFRGRPTPRWILDLHRFLGGLSVVFTGVHVAAVVADDYVHFGAADILVPFASGWRPGAVALGVVALYLLAAVEVTSLLMKRIPRRWWRAVHMTSFGAWLLGTLHAVLAGADASNPLMVVTVNVSVATVLFLTLVRLTAGRGVRASRVPTAEREREVGERATPVA